MRLKTTYITSAILAATLALPVAAFAQTNNAPLTQPTTNGNGTQSTSGDKQTTPSQQQDKAASSTPGMGQSATMPATETPTTESTSNGNGSQSTSGDKQKTPSEQQAGTDAAMSPEGIHAAVEQRIADLHETLHITKAQDARFNEFAQVMLDNAQAMEAQREKHMTDMANMTAEEDLRQYAAMVEMHAKHVERLSKAFDRLYGELSPEQKKAADDAFRTASMERQQKKAGG